MLSFCTESVELSYLSHCVTCYIVSSLFLVIKMEVHSCFQKEEYSLLQHCFNNYTIYFKMGIWHPTSRGIFNVFCIDCIAMYIMYISVAILKASGQRGRHMIIYRISVLTLVTAMRTDILKCLQVSVKYVYIKC